MQRLSKLRNTGAVPIDDDNPDPDTSDHWEPQSVGDPESGQQGQE
jgi:hypothetical protein